MMCLRETTVYVSHSIDTSLMPMTIYKYMTSVFKNKSIKHQLMKNDFAMKRKLETDDKLAS